MLRRITQIVSEKINRSRFNKSIANILDTSPVERGDFDFILLSMVHHRDVEPYLLAVKSFARFINPKSIVVVTDPSITENDRFIISSHLKAVTFTPSVSMHDNNIPKGGCWERLTAISDLVREHYVIQLDADTACLEFPVEVADAVTSGRSFVLGTVDDQVIEPSSLFASRGKHQLETNGHVQAYAEANLDGLDQIRWSKYVRGCAGFSGFTKQSFSRGDLINVSRSMSLLLRDKWSAWGTEQFTSNLIVANSDNALVLPHPKYCHPGWERHGTIFLHFIGYVRFKTKRYAEVAKQIISELRSSYVA